MLWLIRVRRLFRTVGREALILWYALRHPGTPAAIKLATVLMALYLFSPLDIVPDFAVLFGWADDLMLLLVGIPFLAKRLPPEVFAEAAARAERWVGRADGVPGASRR
ncbi:MAG: DUF1232 domain-containing protein [Burkholderiaceae bacterium]